MSSIVKAKCPGCKTEVSVEEQDAEQPVECSSCQRGFVPAMVIAESNKQFEKWMYVAMFLIGLGLVAYMAMTGNLRPRPVPDAPAVPQAVEAIE